MLNRLLILFILAAVLTVSVAGEVIEISRLKGGEKKFTIQRDIFSPNKIVPRDKPRVVTPPPPPVKKPTEIEEKEKEKKIDIAAETRRSVVFEGYVLKYSKNHALLSVNGEFFIAAEGDVVMDKINIVKIEKKQLTVQVESIIVKINLKGDDENEQQGIFQ